MIPFEQPIGTDDQNERLRNNVMALDNPSSAIGLLASQRSERFENVI